MRGGLWFVTIHRRPNVNRVCREGGVHMSHGEAYCRRQQSVRHRYIREIGGGGPDKSRMIGLSMLAAIFIHASLVGVAPTAIASVAGVGIFAADMLTS